ncbi:hypothetical protein D3C71_1886540 [compost metagenome]
MADDQTDLLRLQIIDGHNEDSPVRLHMHHAVCRTLLGKQLLQLLDGRAFLSA